MTEADESPVGDGPAAASAAASSEAASAGDAQLPEPVATTPEAPLQPTLRERLRPLELLGMSAALAVFAGLVTLFVIHPWGEFADQAAHSWLLILVVFGAAFILSLVTLAMLALGGYEPPQESPSQVLQPPDEPHSPH